MRLAQPRAPPPGQQMALMALRPLPMSHPHPHPRARSTRTRIRIRIRLKPRLGNGVITYLMRGLGHYLVFGWGNMAAPWCK